MKKIILMILSVSLTAKAADPVKLEKDSPAPFTGLLFSETKALELRNSLIDLDTEKKLNLSFQRELQLKNSSLEFRQNEVTLLQERNNKLSSSLMDERTMTTWERIGWFSLGIVATGLAFYGASKIQK